SAKHRALNSVYMTSVAERLVVVGNGMAGIACVENILEQAPDRFDITVFGAERAPNYNRILLSSLLNGDVTAAEIVLNPERWYAEHRTRLQRGDRVERIGRERHEVHAAPGGVAPYDKVPYATGSSALILPLSGRDAHGVFVFRTLEDCDRIVTCASGARRG